MFNAGNRSLTVAARKALRSRDRQGAFGTVISERTLSGAKSGVQEPALPLPSAASGTVVRGDYLSRLLHRSEIGWGLMLIRIAVAFGLGAMHALSPGHGKTIVAAYLVGSRGTYKHAVFLGVAHCPG